ncbi:hypothetical protein niasHS_000550 [Heterodera schachtii]|uniref:Kinesin-like protein n=2 Tax=Heterodera TaxID=34509 RepID=A0ABD2K4J8_HETSC
MKKKIAKLIKSNNSVRVAVRIRPQGLQEIQNKLPVCLSVTPGEPQLTISRDKSFTYDFVFDQMTLQKTVYDKCVRELVDGAFEGYNATVFAYGQTGSGKTFTMGTSLEADPAKRGIIPNAAQQIFDEIEERRDQARRSGKVIPSFEVSAQFIELYNEELIDLLSPDRDSSSIKIKENPINHEILLMGASSRNVTSQEAILSALAIGAQNRTTAATNMNKQSSRSHAIFTLNIKQTRVVPVDDDSDEKENNTANEGDDEEESSEKMGTGAEVETLHAKFHFIDLAGSERLSRTGATGDRAKESISINSGLLALGNVISALGGAKGRIGSVHVPYRDSKLTRLLQDSLGGNSRTFMLTCVSPNEVDANETLSSLNYANRAKNIKNKVVANQNKSSTLITQLRIQNQMLKAELHDWETGKRRRSGHIAIAEPEDKNSAEEFFGCLARLDEEEEEEDADNEEEPEEMEHERICTDLDKLQENISSKERQMADYEKELERMKQEINRLEESKKENKQEMRRLEETKKENKRMKDTFDRQMEEKARLVRELESMRKQKVDLVKRQREENKRIRDLMLANNKKLATRDRLIRQQEIKIQRLERANTQKSESLKRKMEEMQKLKKKERRKTMFETNNSRKPLAQINEQLTPESKHLERLNTTYIVDTPSEEQKKGRLLGELPEEKDSNYQIPPVLSGCCPKGPSV